MSRELADGLMQGENPRKIARRLNDRVDNVGLHRGRLIARTETVRAHNEAALNRYADMQERIDGVRTLAEHVTAGDTRVCPVCIALAGNEYTIPEARGRIPVHPNCRCTWLPIRQGPDDPSTPGDRGLLADADAVLADDSLSPSEQSLGLGDALTNSRVPVDAGDGWADLDPDRARVMLEAVDDMANAGELAALGEQSMGVTLGATTNPPNGWNAVYNWDEMRVRVDPDGLDRGAWEQAVRAGHNEGRIGNAAKNPIYHEFGHARHHAAMLDHLDETGEDLGKTVSSWVTDEATKDVLTSEVSAYSTTNGFEVVAEMFTGKLQGKSYPAKLEGLYDFLGGPEVGDDTHITVNTALAAQADGDVPGFDPDAEAAAVRESFEAWYADWPGAFDAE